MPTSTLPRSTRHNLLLRRPWTPKRIAGLGLWIDGASPTGLADGAAIASWPDRSGSGAIIAQSTGANQMTFKNTGGIPRLQGGASKWLNITNLPAYSSGAFTLFMVTKPATVASDQYMFGIGGANQALIIGNTYWEANQTNVYLSSGLVASTADYGIYSAVGDTTGTRPGVGCSYNGKYSFKQQNRNGTTWLATTGVTTAYLGSYQGAAASNFTGDTRCVLLWNRILTDMEQRRVADWLAAKYGLTANQVSPTYNIVADGNSLFTGYSTTPANIDKVVEGLPATKQRMINLGIGGQTTATMITNYPTKTAPLFNGTKYGTGNILLFLEGTNDLHFGATATQAYNNIVSYCGLAKATGYRVLVATILPRDDAGNPADFETSRQTVNTNIRNNILNFADGVVDIGGDATIGAPGAQTNTTYFNADKTHLTTAGYAIVANLFLTAIAALG